MSDGAWSNQVANLIILNAATKGFSGFFVYSPEPGPGNLIGSWSAVAGVDPYGNAYPAGLDVAQGALAGVTVSALVLIADLSLMYTTQSPTLGSLAMAFSPEGGTGTAMDSVGNVYPTGEFNFGTWDGTGTLRQHFGLDLNGSAYLADSTGTTRIFESAVQNVPFSLAGILAGSLSSLLRISSSDPNEVQQAVIGSFTLGTGTTAKMCTLLTSPFLSNGMAVLLQAENDGSTDKSIMTIGTLAVSGATLTFTPVAAFTPFAFILYGTGGTVTITTETSGSGNIAIPAGVTSAYGEAWGSGAGGQDNPATGNGGGAGGGGEYAAEPALVVPSGGNVAYVVAGGGAAGTGGGNGAAGGSSTLTGSAVTVTGHGGSAGVAAGGAGGTGSANTVHNNGGAGAAGTQGSASPVTVKITGAGTHNWTAPAGVTSALVEQWGGGGGGAGGGLAGGANSGGFGGGGGEYAASTITVVPLTVYSLLNGAGGSGGAPNNFGNTGGASNFNFGQVTANGGQATSGVGVSKGGTGGTGGTLHNGGNGGSATSTGGSGGGGAGGSSGSGGNGVNNTGGGPVSGGSGNGAGGDGGNSGGANANGNQGFLPGGGGGGAGGGAGAGTGGTGRSGQTWITYTPPSAQAGGGGGSAGTSAAGNAGTTEQGALAVAGGGPGGGVLSGGVWTAAPSTGPGGGAGGYDASGPAGAGAGGQVRLTYVSGAPSIQFSSAAAAGTDQYGNAYQVGTYHSGQLTLAGIATPATPAAGNGTVYATTAGTPAEVLPSGWQGEISTSPAADFTHFTVTAASFAQCTKAWSIPAGDAQVGTTYRITYAGLATQGTTAEKLAFQFSNGDGVCTLPAGSLAAGISIAWHVVMEVTVITTGSGGTANYSIVAGANQVNNTTTNDCSAYGFTQGAAFNTTSAFTLEGQALWGSASVGCTLTCYQSFLERLGP